METTENLHHGSWPLQATKSASLGLSVLLCVLLVALFAQTVSIAVQSPPSFDGAMNLQVAESVAAGEGFRRNYAAREAFPHEIQTGAPYIFPAAGVFKLWGVGIAQAEVVSIVYLGLLLIVVYWLIAPLGGLPLALFGACTVIMVPGLHRYGLYGYGEIPCLMWALAAIALYFRGKGNVWRGLAAGMMLGFAVYTKTVMLIGAGALGLCALLQLIEGWRDRELGRRRRFAALVLGGIAVIVAMETWRSLALGGVDAWLAWWRASTSNIFTQAGVKSNFGKTAHSLLTKFEVHFNLLSHDYHMSLVLTGVWLALLLAAAITVVLRGIRQGRMSWATLAVLLAALVYFGWWLLITPTAKAWHRRILDGMICADIGLIMTVAPWLHLQTRAKANRLRKLWVFVPALAALVLPAMWLAKGSNTLLLASVNRETCKQQMAEPTRCANLNPGASVQMLKHVADAVRALPHNAYVFAFGWYSAPRVGWLAERHILDFHDVPITALQRSRPIYFVQGSMTPQRSLRRVRLLYGIRATPVHSYAVIRAPTLNTKPLVPGAPSVARYVTAADHYAYLRGFNQSEGTNGRWLTSDNQVLLSPQPGDVFELVAAVLPIDSYQEHRTPHVTVTFDGCKAAAQPTTPGQLNRLRFAIPPYCDINTKRPVTVRIEVDNIVDSTITHDARQLTVLGKSFGFVPRQHHAASYAKPQIQLRYATRSWSRIESPFPYGRGAQSVIEIIKKGVSKTHGSRRVFNVLSQPHALPYPGRHAGTHVTLLVTHEQ